MRKLYHCAGARSMRSVWLLHELGLEFELVTLGFSMAALRTPEYLAISPLGRVPCLVDGDVTLFESGAICQYLCERYDAAGVLHRAPGHAERTPWLQWLHYAETVAVHGASLVQQQVFVAPADRSMVVIKLESRRLRKALEVLAQALQGRDYLLASGFSAVDTAVGYSVHLARELIGIDGLPSLEAYYARLAARPAFQRALDQAPIKAMKDAVPGLA
ncbi:MAG: glutathione S-transferase family protein [Proteobacteria bacterium]|nr:glutathione S-transferase family protein [Pseudomonadota bacterium]